MQAFHHVTLGVSNLDQSVDFWRDQLGLAEVARREAPDPQLAERWRLPADACPRQVLLRSPGHTAGAMLLVEFSEPGKPVREGAEATDRVPKNLDVYTSDLPDRQDELIAAGHRFKSPWGETTAPNGMRFREAHMHGADAVNVVLLEVLDSEIACSDEGYASVGALVTTVGDVATEALFYRDVLGLATLMENILGGPELEKIIGLPPGCGLDVRILGAENEWMGRMELIEYQGKDGADLYPLARAPRTGILEAGWLIPDLSPLLARLEAAEHPVELLADQQTLAGAGRLACFRSPAGMPITVLENADARG